MKSRAQYVCQQCGYRHSKWSGRCQECSAWNSVIEEAADRGKPSGTLRLPNAGEAARPIGSVPSEDARRTPTGIGELDSVLGGGIVAGSVTLLGGEPGVGKSTLLLQLAAQVAAHGSKVLYASGEESAAQIALRAGRLGISSDNLLVLSETSIETILEQVKALRPGLLIVDSIQTMHTSTIDSQPGNVSQLRECTYTLINEAKARMTPAWLVGHVTKDGAIAGPKVLEHMVDVVLYLESGTLHGFRVVRGIKNRFGPTNEIGVFEMQAEGFREVPNPSELFLAERPDRTPGSVITASLEGTRPILVEVQALVSQTALALPRRTSIGVDPNRVSLLVAILEKRGGYHLYDQDVYVNIAGGLRLSETASDLAVIASLISSTKGEAIEAKTLVFGEVGLGGEVRGVSRGLERVREGARVGLKRALLPASTAKDLPRVPGVEMVPVAHIQELADRL